MALLASVTFDFGYGHALQAELGEGLAHLIELEWLDDRHHQLHLLTPPYCGFRSDQWSMSRVNLKGESNCVPTPPRRSDALALRGCPDGKRLTGLLLGQMSAHELGKMDCLPKL